MDDEILDEKNYENRTIRYASFIERLAAFLIDILLLVTVAYGMFRFFGWGFSFTLFLRANWWQFLLLICMYFIFFSGSEKNATFGMQIMDIRMLTIEKRDIDFKIAFLHLILSVILFFGFFFLLFGKQQTLADEKTNVFVIKVK